MRFRYGDGEPEVLKGVSLVIEAGETLTITGPSGGEKTTLMKLMLGLIEPTSGEVLVDDIPLNVYGKAAYRHQVGVIMQDDLLYSGSIAENIALFDTEVDLDRVHEVAQQAAIAAEITKMPMGYESLVGDMGSSLSGGQRQRVLIARALYRSPRFIFADEATSSLDDSNRESIRMLFGHANATKILITHSTFMTTTGHIIIMQDGVINGAVPHYSV